MCYRPLQCLADVHYRQVPPPRAGLLHLAEAQRSPLVLQRYPVDVSTSLAAGFQTRSPMINHSRFWSPIIHPTLRLDLVGFESTLPSILAVLHSAPNARIRVYLSFVKLATFGADNFTYLWNRKSTWLCAYYGAHLASPSSFKFVREMHTIHVRIIHVYIALRWLIALPSNMRYTAMLKVAIPVEVYPTLCC